MADDEDVASEELAFYDDATSLSWNRWQSYHTGKTKQEIEYLQFKAWAENKIAQGEPIYCQITEERRQGSVGKITNITFDYRPSKPPPPNASHWNRGTGAFLGIDGIEVAWDGRKNRVKPDPSEVEVLEWWSKDTGTIWHWNPVVKEKVPEITAYDHLGQKIEVGQNVCFVHRRYGNIDMMFGTVTRLTPKGGVFIKRLKLRDNDHVDEYRALSMDDVIIINDQLMSRLVMARLAAQ